MDKSNKGYITTVHGGTLADHISGYLQGRHGGFPGYYRRGDSDIYDIGLCPEDTVATDEMISDAVGFKNGWESAMGLIVLTAKGE